MILSELPAEVLCLVLSGSASRCALLLWLCGNRLLNAKLEQGGVKDLVLHLPRAPGQAKMPSCVNSFRLRSLLIDWPSATLGQPADTFIHLNRSLTSLTVRTENCLSTFFPSTSPIPQKPALKKQKLSETQLSPNIDWNDVFPSLKELKFIDFQGLPRSISRLSAKNFAMLPQTLHTLHINITNWDEHMVESAIENLPPFLTDLVLPVRSITDEGLYALSASTRHLRKMGYEMLTIAAWRLLFIEIAVLFPNLQEFPSPKFPVENSDHMLRMARETKSWPNIIDKLKFREGNVSILFSMPFPSSLTELDLGSPLRFDIEAFIQDASDLQLSENAPLFPATLKKFCSNGSIGARMLEYKMFHQNLEHLCIENVNFEGITPAQWPSKLTRLEAKRQKSTCVGAFSRLPRGLKHLSLNLHLPHLKLRRTPFEKVDGAMEVADTRKDLQIEALFLGSSHQQSLKNTSNNEEEEVEEENEEKAAPRKPRRGRTNRKEQSEAPRDADTNQEDDRKFEEALATCFREKARTMLQTEDKEAWSEICEQKKKFPSRFSTSNMKAIERGEHFGLPLGLESFEMTKFHHTPQQGWQHVVLPPFVKSASLFPPSAKRFFETSPILITSLSIAYDNDKLFWKGFINDGSETNNFDPVQSPLYNMDRLLRVQFIAPFLSPRVLAYLPRYLAWLQHSLTANAPLSLVDFQPRFASTLPPLLNGYSLPSYLFHYR